MDLVFDDSIHMHSRVKQQERAQILRNFINRVDRTLASHTNAPINRFSLKCKDDVGPAPVIAWINNVLKRNLSELVLDISSCWDWPMSSSIVGVDTMVEEIWKSCSVSTTTLKRATIRFNQIFIENHKNVSFDTPNLLYLDYSDVIAANYPKARFDSLIEARLHLQMSHDQIEKRFSEFDLFREEVITLGNATRFFSGIRNVKRLHLSDSTLNVLTFCCKLMPVFDKLIQLSVKTDRDVGWESLTSLLKNSPNLETLVFDGLLHRFDEKCKSEDCICKPSWENEEEEEEEEDDEDEEEEEIITCLSSSPVKKLEIFKFGVIDEDEDMDKMMEQVEYFLETMPKLEKLIVHYETSIDEDVVEVLHQFKMVPRDGLTKCKIQIVSDNLNLSST